MSNKIKGLLFDKDGTLFDFSATWAAWTSGFIKLIADGSEARTALSNAFGFNMQTGTFQNNSLIVASTPGIILDTVLETLPHLNREFLERQLLSSSSSVELVESVPLAPLLDQFLAHDLKLGVATNDLEAVARAHLETMSIIEKFDFVAGFDSGYGAKPDPGMPNAFCKSTGLAPIEVAMIGDSRHDLIAGRAAGMVTVAVLTGPASAYDLAPFADVTLPNIGGLPFWLDHASSAPNTTRNVGAAQE